MWVKIHHDHEDRGQRMLIAALSNDNVTEASGISLIQAVARAAASAMTSS